MAAVEGDTIFLIMNDHIDNIFFLGYFFSVLLQDDIVVGKKGIGADRREIPGNGHSPFPGLLHDDLGLPFLHQQDGEDHQKEDQEGRVEDESGLKTNGFKVIFGIHLDSRTGKLIPFAQPDFFHRDIGPPRALTSTPLTYG